MTDLRLPTDAKKALHIVCLMLAQPDSPHTKLGYKTALEAFKDIGEKFAVSPNTVKNERDAFDHHTKSTRVGWKADLRPSLQSIYDEYSSVDEDELNKLCLEILNLEWGDLEEMALKTDLFDNVVNESSRIKVDYPNDGINVIFSNSRRRSDGWFLLTIKQILETLECLINNNKTIISKVKNPAKYKQDDWREIFANEVTNKVVSTMGVTQTLPTFELLSKIIHHSNSSSARTQNEIILDISALETAKKKLSSWKPIRISPVFTAIASTYHGGENVIFYGAPGTGKTTTVDKEIKGKKYVRTVFHPDLQNSDFFGCLKPHMVGTDVGYKFAPGPFMKAYAMALEHYDQPVYLVIEELNRAAAAAVFGDLFLLLDRKPDGTGEYDVDFPTTESRDWLEDKLSKVKSAVPCPEKLIIPSNLFIYATMNSADQGVYPIDTAFRRRWRHNYLPIDYKHGRAGNVAYVVDNSGTKREMEWPVFVKKLNTFLLGNKELEIAEDRLLGQWFVKEKELDGKSIPETLLVYLWDDLLRHEDRNLIFHTDINMYGDLAERIKNDEVVFSKNFLEKLNPVAPGSTLPGSEEEADASS